MLNHWTKIQIVFNVLIILTLICTLIFSKTFELFIVFLIICTVEVFLYAVSYFIVRILNLKKK